MENNNSIQTSSGTLVLGNVIEHPCLTEQERATLDLMEAREESIYLMIASIFKSRYSQRMDALQWYLRYSEIRDLVTAYFGD